MKFRWVLGGLFWVALSATAQSGGQISVTVADGVATVSPQSYQFAPGQASVTVALGTRGYTITGVAFAEGSGLFNCSPARNGTYTCAVGQREPGGRATYTVRLSGNGSLVTSDPGIFIQSE